jgi:hypothetical protein
MKYLMLCAVWLTALIVGGNALATSVTYTYHTVSDGALGPAAFQEALVTITYTSDTRDVVTTTTVSGAKVLTNSHGSATVTVTQNGTSTMAHFAAGQIHVRYDVTNGVVGFGSVLGDTYPLALGCDIEDGTCSKGVNVNQYFDDYFYDDGIVAALTYVVDNPANANLVSPEVLTERATLSHTTLLTGTTYACLGDYVSNFYLCPGTPPTLSTDHGGFYLRDMSGGRNVGTFSVKVTESD